MSDFFTFSIPTTNVGFGQFSAGHFVWLAAGLLFCLLLRRGYRQSSRKRRFRILVSSGTLLLELLRAFMLMEAGEYTVFSLPLHLCGLSVYLNLIHALSGREKLGQFLYAFCFPGAVFALLFPDWDYFPLFNILTTMDFLLHILIVSYVVMQIEEIQPSLKSAPHNLASMLLLAIPIYIFNKHASTNYMFLNWPVPPLTIFRFLGKPGYLLGYLPFIAFTWSLLYLPFLCTKHRTFGNKK